MVTGTYKRIESLIASHIAKNYRRVAEVGVGENVACARLLARAGLDVFCTDIRPGPPDGGIRFFRDDVFSPSVSLYRDRDLIYSIRPGEEMVPPLIALAREVDCDLLVYHLGFEGYGRGGELIDCGVILHRYHRCQNPSKRVL